MWPLWREISWLKHLSKDRCMRRRYNYGMHASLAMHSKAHQEIFKETSILGMCIGERKGKWKNGRKLWRQTVHGCTCTRYLSLSPSFSFSSSIRTFYRESAIAHSLSYSILSPLILVLISSFSLYTHSSLFFYFISLQFIAIECLCTLAIN